MLWLHVMCVYVLNEVGTCRGRWFWFLPIDLKKQTEEVEMKDRKENA